MKILSVLATAAFLPACTMTITTSPDGTVTEKKEFDRDAFEAVSDKALKWKQADLPVYEK